MSFKKLTEFYQNGNLYNPQEYIDSNMAKMLYTFIWKFCKS